MDGGGGNVPQDAKFPSHRYVKIDKTNNGQIGDGAYGVVYRAYDIIEKEKVALKRIKLENEDGKCGRLFLATYSPLLLFSPAHSFLCRWG